METGKPIYVESLMTPEQWKERLNKYSTSSVETYPKFFDSEYKWRWRMGESLSKDEIIRINKRIDLLKELLKEKEEV